MTNTYNAVIFDLDGTLLDTVEDLAFAMNSVLRKHGFPTHDISDYRYFVGGGLANLVYQTIPSDMRQPSLIEIYLYDLMHEYSKSMDAKTKPYPGITQLLDGLTTKNIHLAILSNKDHQFMDAIVKTHFNNWLFKVVFGARNGVPTKPNPQSALEIASIIDIDPQNIIYVGDTDIDMKTATRAGMYPVGAAWGFRTQEELIANGAKMIIQHPTDLLSLL